MSYAPINNEIIYVLFSDLSNILDQCAIIYNTTVYTDNPCSLDYCHINLRSMVCGFLSAEDYTWSWNGTLGDSVHPKKWTRPAQISE